MEQNKNIKKRYLIFCEPCSFKRIVESDNPDDIVLIKRSSIPGKAINLDAKKKEKDPKIQKQSTMCKCPRCGRGATMKSLPDVYVKTFKELEKKTQKEEEEKAKKKRLEDGKPHERRVDPDFSG